MNPGLTTIHPEMLTMSPDQFALLCPYLFCIVGAIVALLFCTLPALLGKWATFLTAILTICAGIAASVQIFLTPGGILFNSMMIVDPYSQFFNILFLGTALITVLSSFRYLDREGIQHPEYYVLVLFSAIGMMLMVSALDMIVLFISLEIMSLSVYTLVGFRRSDRKSNEAAMKYFILGGVASAILLYGVALIYGVTGSNNISEIVAFTQRSVELPILFSVGALLVIAGFLFKVAAVPFHMWMPDVYEGAPTPITGFMTTGLKAAAFATFLRVFISLGLADSISSGFEDKIHHIIWIAGALTMIVGNLIALTQVQLKRMLAYSSIAHTGYILIGFVSAGRNEIGFSAIVVYLLGYAIMNIGAFVILTMLSSKGDGNLTLQEMSGISNKHPWLAFSMAVFLFSMAGIPPTVGFVAKYWLFYSAIQSGEYVLVILGVLCSAISVYYYLRVLVYMYMREWIPSDVVGEQPQRFSKACALAVCATLILTIAIGVMPTHILQIARQAVIGL